ncbi:MAG: hypothetical protein U9N18_02840 [Campylobacterota bacterium]|nr:hypothetical protein [Campylobacterota bacterium]
MFYLKDMLCHTQDLTVTLEPAKKTDLHRAVPKGLNLDDILCKKVERVLKKDFTISYEKKLYQIEDKIRAKRITVQEHINGDISLRYKDRALHSKEITNRPKRVNEGQKTYLSKLKKPYISPKDHPQRKFNIRSHSQFLMKLECKTPFCHSQ